MDPQPCRSTHGKHETTHAALRAGNDITGRVWSTHDAPPDYIDSMVRAIVGIEIAITNIEGKAKFSQNRSVEDIAGVIADLHDGSSSDRGTAHDMAALTERSENH